MLEHARIADHYRFADIFFSLEANRVKGKNLPKDEAQQFFASHLARLDNLGVSRMEQSEKRLIKNRSENITLAQTLYTDLQRQALNSSTVREERKIYLLHPQPLLAAS